MEIENPGTLPVGWSVEKLKSGHNSEPQNPLIANVLYKRKILESWGRGISLIMEECRKANLPEPEFNADASQVKLVFRYRALQQVTGQVMSLVSTLKNNVLSLKEIMERLSLTGRDNFITGYLNPAMKDRLIEQTHPENPKHPKQKYRLTDKGKDLLKQ